MLIYHKAYAREIVKEISISEFVEQLGITLLPYQKKYLEYINLHPDIQIIFPRGRCDLRYTYAVIHNLLYKEYLKENKENPNETN